MLKHCKISEYKIKKILRCFAEDYTASDTSRLLKLNRNTINRYYDLFRKIIEAWLKEIIKQNSQNSTYIGYIKCGYGQVGYLKAFKVSSKLFYNIHCIEEPTPPEAGNTIFLDQDFLQIARFLYKRFSQFRTFTKKSYFNQLNEVIIRYNFSNDEIFEHLLKNMKKEYPK